MNFMHMTLYLWPGSILNCQTGLLYDYFKVLITTLLEFPCFVFLVKFKFTITKLHLISFVLNVRLHVTDFGMTFHDTKNFRLLSWSVRSPDLSLSETSVQWWPNDWLNTIHQSLLLQNCAIFLRLHGQLYLYMLNNLWTIQYPRA